LANELATLTKQISEGIDANQGGLQQAKIYMDLMMKGEGLENAPR